jgi:YVTN family beta-propeller protein
MVKRIATMALLLASLASGQWLGEKLSLLDPFGIPAGHQSLAYNNHNHRVYVAGDESDSLLVIDADRCKSLARVGVGRPVGAMCYNPSENKLYCACSNADTVAVLDGTTLQILANVGVGDSAGTFCYDSLDNKMYVGNWGSRSVSVIDCRLDIAVATVGSCGGAQGAPYGMCFVPAHRTVYVTSRADGTVATIDCLSDTVIAKARVGQEPLALCYNPTNDRLYCACWGDAVYGIDGASNDIVSVIPRGYALSLACNPVRNVLFVPDGGGLVVVDCSADTVIAGIELPDGGGCFVEYDPVGSTVYVAADVDGCWTPGAVTVLDGESYEVRTWFRAFYTVDAVCMTQAPGRLFVAGGADEDVRVVAFDGATGLLRGLWRDRAYADGLLTDSKSGKLYCLSDAYLVWVVDPMTGRVLSTAPVTGLPAASCVNAIDNKVYVAVLDWDGRGKITVLDGVGDTLLNELVIYGDPWLLAFDSADDVLYEAGEYSHRIQAIDGKLDRVIGSLQVGEVPVGLVFNGAQRRLYSLGCDSTVTVIDPNGFCADKRIRVGTGLDCSVLNTTGTRLYGGGPKQPSVYVIDCIRETLACAIPVDGPPVALCYCQPYDRLYSASATDGGSLSVIDCARDAVVAVLPVEAKNLLYDTLADAVYCLGDSGLRVIDRQSNRIVQSFAASSYLRGISSAPAWPNVYVAAGDEPNLYVIPKPEGPAELAVRAVPDEQATMVRGRLNWTGTLAVMYDKCGRRVADLHRGGNDVSGLQPGVYFIRENGIPRGTYARKVVIAE